LQFMSHKVFLKSFCKRQFPHKSVNVFSALVMIKDKLTNLCENRFLQNDCIDCIDTFCTVTSVCLAGEGPLVAM